MKTWKKYICGIVTAVMLLQITPLIAEDPDPDPDPAPVIVKLASPSRDGMTFPLGYRLTPSVWIEGSDEASVEYVKIFVNDVDMGIAEDISHSVANNANVKSSKFGYLYYYQFKYVKDGGLILTDTNGYRIKAKAYAIDDSELAESEEIQINVLKQKLNQSWNFDFEEGSAGTNTFDTLFPASQYEPEPSPGAQKVHNILYGKTDLPPVLEEYSGVLGDKVFGIQRDSNGAAADNSKFVNVNAQTTGFDIRGTLPEDPKPNANTPIFGKDEKIRVEYDVFFVKPGRQMTFFSLSGGGVGYPSTADVAELLVMDGGNGVDTVKTEIVDEEEVIVVDDNGDPVIIEGGSITEATLWLEIFATNDSDGREKVRINIPKKIPVDTLVRVAYEIDFAEKLIDIYVDGDRVISQQEFVLSPATGDTSSISKNGVRYMRWRSVYNSNGNYRAETYVDNYKIGYYTEDDTPEGEFKLDDTSLNVIGDTVTATATYTNDTISPQDSTLILALFNGQRMVDVAINSDPVAEFAGTVTKTIPYQLEAGTEYTQARLYVWNRFTGFVPMLEEPLTEDIDSTDDEGDPDDDIDPTDD